MERIGVSIRAMIDWIFKYVKHPYTALVCRIGIGLVLLIAGYIKLIDMAAFADSVENYRALPVSMIHLFAIILPAVEVVVGVCLIFGFAIQGAVFIATGLFVMFAVAIESALLRGLDIDCGCFGTVDANIVGVQALARDVVFLFMTIPVWLTSTHLFAIDQCCSPFRVSSTDNYPGAD